MGQGNPFTLPRSQQSQYTSGYSGLNGFATNPLLVMGIASLAQKFNQPQQGQQQNPMQAQIEQMQQPQSPDMAPLNLQQHMMQQAQQVNIPWDQIMAQLQGGQQPPVTPAPAPVIQPPASPMQNPFTEPPGAQPVPGYQDQYTPPVQAPAEVPQFIPPTPVTLEQPVAQEFVPESELAYGYAPDTPEAVAHYFPNNEEWGARRWWNGENWAPGSAPGTGDD